MVRKSEVARDADNLVCWSERNISQGRCYCRCGAPLSRRRLLLSTIKPIGQVEQPTTPVTKISDKSLANLIADADKVLERNTPVADEEWWQDFRAAMLELQERRREELK